MMGVHGGNGGCATGIRLRERRAARDPSEE